MISAIRRLQSIAPIPGPLVEQFYELVQQRTIKKKQHLLRSGQICDHVFFVEQGFFRCYFKNQESEVTIWFMKEDDIFTSPVSFYSRLPSFENIQALEDSIVYSIHYKELEIIYENFPQFNLVGRIITEQYNILLSKYNYIARIKPAEARYAFLEEYFPHLPGRITDKQIASFLSITDAHLSRIKHRRG